jgi:hypothetical protein
MKYIKGKNRTQTYLFPISLEESIDQDNEVRIIDFFCKQLIIKGLRFQDSFCGKRQTSLPPCRSAQIVHLWLYEQSAYLS